MHDPAPARQQQPVGNGALDQLGRTIEVFGPCENRGIRGPVFRFDEMPRRRHQCADQRFDILAPLVQHGFAQGQHLFHAAPPDLRGRQHDPPRPAFNRDRVPRFAHADPVNLARFQRVGAERRGDGDDFDVVIGADAIGRQPIAQHVVMAGIAVDHPEAQPPAPGRPDLGHRGQRGADHAGFAQPVGLADMVGQLMPQRDGVAVQPQHERHRQRLCGPSAPQRCRNRQRRNHVGGIRMAIEQPVQHAPFGDDENLAIVKRRQILTDHRRARRAFIDNGNPHKLLRTATRPGSIGD